MSLEAVIVLICALIKSNFNEINNYKIWLDWTKKVYLYRYALCTERITSVV